MNWTIPQIITSGVSIVALVISIANFVVARISAHKEAKRRKRDDLLLIDQLLNDAFDHLYGNEGYLSTKDRKKLDDAEICISKATKLDPQHPRSIEYEGHLFEIQGNKNLAQARYSRSITLDKTRARPHNCLGFISEGDEAMVHFKRAIELEPEQPLFYYNLGRVYLTKNQINKAENCFRKAIELRPKYSWAHYELGSLLRKQKKYEEAKREYELAIAADSKHINGMANLGALLIGDLGREEEGIAWFEHAIKIDPSDDYPLAMLAAVYADLNQPERALEYAKQAMAINPTRRFSGDNLSELQEAMQVLLSSRDSKAT